MIESTTIIHLETLYQRKGQVVMETSFYKDRAIMLDKTEQNDVLNHHINSICNTLDFRAHLNVDLIMSIRVNRY